MLRSSKGIADFTHLLRRLAASLAWLLRELDHVGSLQQPQKDVCVGDGCQRSAFGDLFYWRQWLSVAIADDVRQLSIQPLHGVVLHCGFSFG